MAIDVNNPYFRTKVLTASPEELRLMLIEGCIRFMREGREAMDARRHEKTFEAFSNAKNILLELMTSLRHELAPELCANMDALYTYMFRRLTEGNFEKDPGKVDEVIGLMEYERETWALLMAKLAEERAGEPAAAAGPVAHDAVRAGAGQTAIERRPISVQG